MASVGRIVEATVTAVEEANLSIILSRGPCLLFTQLVRTYLRIIGNAQGLASWIVLPLSFPCPLWLPPRLACEPSAFHERMASTPEIST